MKSGLLMLVLLSNVSSGSMCWNLERQEAYCSDRKIMLSDVNVGEEITDFNECKTAVQNDSDCESTFYTNGENCRCLETGETCNFGASISSKNNVYSYKECSPVLTNDNDYTKLGNGWCRTNSSTSDKVNGRRNNNIGSANDCAAECDDQVNCNGFAYGVVATRCYIYGEGLETNVSAPWTSYAKTLYEVYASSGIDSSVGCWKRKNTWTRTPYAFESMGEGWCRTSNGDRVNGRYRFNSPFNGNDCESQCDAESYCVGYSFNAVSGKCYIYGYLLETNVPDGWFSYSKKSASIGSSTGSDDEDAYCNVKNIDCEGAYTICSSSCEKYWETTVDQFGSGSHCPASPAPCYDGDCSTCDLVNTGRRRLQDNAGMSQDVGVSSGSMCWNLERPGAYCKNKKTMLSNLGEEITDFNGCKTAVYNDADCEKTFYTSGENCRCLKKGYTCDFSSSSSNSVYSYKECAPVLTNNNNYTKLGNGWCRTNDVGTYKYVNGRKNDNISSADACAAKCDEKVKCNGFAYGVEETRCYIYGEGLEDLVDLVVSTDWLSSSKRDYEVYGSSGKDSLVGCWKKKNTWKRNYEFESMGEGWCRTTTGDRVNGRFRFNGPFNDIDCESQCDVENNCVGYAFNVLSRKCYIHGYLLETNVPDGWFSYSKSSAAIGSSSGSGDGDAYCKIKGQKKPCDVPATPIFTKGGYDCPFNKVDKTYDCFNNNKPYNDFASAFVACENDCKCGALLLTSGQYYLRRLSDFLNQDLNGLGDRQGWNFSNASCDRSDECGPFCADFTGDCSSCLADGNLCLWKSSDNSCISSALATEPASSYEFTCPARRGLTFETISCDMTIDNKVKKVMYNGNELTVSGDVDSWQSKKTFSFTPIPGAFLEIGGEENDDCNGCTCSGMSIECSNGFNSNTNDWEVFGSESFVLQPTENYGTPCISTSGYSLSSSYSGNYEKIWFDINGPENGPKFAWFRGTPVKDPCHNVNCGEHGNCVVGECVCTDDYTGVVCQIMPIDPCDDVDCSDNGNCNDGTCTCFDNYTGDNCERAPECGSRNLTAYITAYANTLGLDVSNVKLIEKCDSDVGTLQVFCASCGSYIDIQNAEDVINDSDFMEQFNQRLADEGLNYTVSSASGPQIDADCSYFDEPCDCTGECGWDTALGVCVDNGTTTCGECASLPECVQLVDTYANCLSSLEQWDLCQNSWWLERCQYTCHRAETECFDWKQTSVCTAELAKGWNMCDNSYWGLHCQMTCGCT